MDALVAERVGPLVTIQDLGRPGWLRSGVGVAGAADRTALRLANRLVGNAETAAGLEVLLGGVTLRALRRVTVAVTGAPAPATVGGIPVGHACVLELAAGAVLRLGHAPAGMRAYVGVRGGIDVAAVLGSRSRDTLSGIGPEPVRAGSGLPVGSAQGRAVWVPNVDVAPIAELTNAPITARVVLGPRADWFDRACALFDGRWTVSPEADRIGIRLDRRDGPPIVRSDRRELPTEGIASGSIQVPPDGRPVVLLADHPITGGYPVVGVVVDADIDRLGQARPGQTIEFISSNCPRSRASGTRCTDPTPR